MAKVTYNPAQQEAIVSDKKYIRVIAGAGAGKTQVNSEVIAHKLNALGAKPEEILAITFSKNGATEIKDRAARTAGHVREGRRRAHDPQPSAAPGDRQDDRCLPRDGLARHEGPGNRGLHRAATRGQGAAARETQQLSGLMES